MIVEVYLRHPTLVLDRNHGPENLLTFLWEEGVHLREAGTGPRPLKLLDSSLTTPQPEPGIDMVDNCKKQDEVEICHLSQMDSTHRTPIEQNYEKVARSKKNRRRSKEKRKARLLKRSTGCVVYECNRPMRGLHFRASTNHRPCCIHTPQTPVLFLCVICYIFYI